MEGHEITKIRLKLGYNTPTEFSDFLGCSSVSVYKYEKNGVDDEKVFAKLMMLIKPMFKSTIESISEIVIYVEHYRRLRLKFGYSTPEKFAYALGVSAKTSYNYDNGSISKVLSMFMLALDRLPKNKRGAYLNEHNAKIR